MRLIDADSIRFKPYYDEYVDYDGYINDLKTWQLDDILSDRVDNTPTVEAIPIEWIKKFIDNDILSETVKILLNAWEWEKENEISVMPVSNNSTIPLDYLGERK